MASKELFHSNMLYWISKEYPDQFKGILEFLGVDTSLWPKNAITCREKDHYDLSVVGNNHSQKSPNFLMILENKVKSIPSRIQLEEYSAKCKQVMVSKSVPQFLLLSLCTDFPQKNEIAQNGWIIKSYYDLSMAIYGILNTITNDYHKKLLGDYCTYIYQLHQIQQGWSFKENDSYLDTVVNINDNEEFKLNDVKKKVLVSRMCVELINRMINKNPNLKSVVQFGNNTTIIDDITSKRAHGNIYINWGMTRSIGLIDVKYVDNNNVLYVIQLQGSQYRHCIETLIDKKSKKNVISSIKNYFNNNLSSKYSSFIVSSGSVFSGTKHAKAPKSVKKYNVFGSSFIYKYVNIQDIVTISEVIDYIINDINSCLNNNNKKIAIQNKRPQIQQP